MTRRRLWLLVLPASAIVAAAATGLYLLHLVDLVADGIGYPAAFAIPVLACLMLGGGLSFLAKKRIHLAPVLLCGGASALVIGWVLFVISQIP